MDLRRSRRVAGVAPSFDEDVEGKAIYDQLISLGYGLEQAHHLAYFNDNREFIRFFTRLRCAGYDETVAVEIAGQYNEDSFFNFRESFYQQGFDDDSVSRELLLNLLRVRTSSKYDNSLIIPINYLAITLMMGVAELNKPRDNKGKVVLAIDEFGDNNPEDILPHNVDDIITQATLSSWRKFTDKLASVSTSKRGYIHLALKNVQLSKTVSDLLVESLRTAPLRSLTLLTNDNLNVEFIIDALEANKWLESLSIEENNFDEDEATSIVNAVICHPKMNMLIIEECRLGQNNAVMQKIIPAFDCLEAISLDRICIESSGMKLISECLSNNPYIKNLYLQDNMINDDDIIELARALETNTNLRLLHIARNNITEVGFEAVEDLLRNLSDLNAIHASNHTCHVTGCNKEISLFNTFTEPAQNRSYKLLEIVNIKGNMHILNEAPIELLPRILFLIQGEGFMDPSKYNSVEAVFLFIRQWSLPLLFTSQIGFEPRRSVRIRKKMVRQCVGKRSRIL